MFTDTNGGAKLCVECKKMTSHTLSAGDATTLERRAAYVRHQTNRLWLSGSKEREGERMSWLSGSKEREGERMLWLSWSKEREGERML